MVIVMTNDSVSVYDVQENDFDKLLSQGLITKNDSRLEHHKVYEILKAGYNPSKLQQQLGDMLSSVDAYYYDNGSFLSKKEVTSLDEVIYYEDENGGLWASQEYEQAMHSGVKISLKQIELTNLDHRLNRYSHLQNLLPPSLITEFKRLYDQDSFIQAKRAEFNHCDSPYVINSFYEVSSVSKLIIRKNNKKLTAALLEDNVFLTVAPAGINDAGETKYFVEEYRITKQDIPEINNLFRKYLKDDKVKVDALTSDERFLYFDRAVREYRQKLIGELEGVSSKARAIVSDTTWTWNAYKAAFLAKYGYPVVDLDNSWIPFDQTTIDARTIHNGYIIPITIESYQRDASSLQNNAIKTPGNVEPKDVKTNRRFISDDSVVDNINRDYPRDYSLLNYPTIEEYITPEDLKQAIASLSDSNPTFSMPESNQSTSLEEAKEPSKTSVKGAEKQNDNSSKEAIIQHLIAQINNNFSTIKAALANLRVSLVPHFYEEVFKIGANYPAEFISTVQDTLTEVSGIDEKTTSYYNSFLITVNQAYQTNAPFVIQKLQNMLNATNRTIESIDKQKERVAFIKEVISENQQSSPSSLDDSPSLEDVKYTGVISHLEGDEFINSTQKQMKKM